MAIFDDIGKKITNAGQNVVKGTKDFADVTRLNSQIAEEQKQIAGVYTQIGGQFYERFGTDETAPFRELCGIITASLARISAYQDEIQQIKGVKLCVNCGSEIVLNAAFCSSCGAPAEQTPERVEERRFCAGCGTELAAGAAFCTNCGQRNE